MNKFSKPKPNDWHLKLLEKPDEVHPGISESEKQALREEYGFDKIPETKKPDPPMKLEEVKTQPNLPIQSEEVKVQPNLRTESQNQPVKEDPKPDLKASGLKFGQKPKLSDKGPQ